MSKRKGDKKTGGRQKGTPNKVNTDIKNIVIQALNEIGGVSYLKVQSELNPVAFMGLVGKVLPLQIKNDVNLAGKMVIEWKGIEE